MRVAKISLPYREQKDDPRYKHINTDLVNLFLCLQGRVRFGDSGVGENIAGEFQQFTSHAVADTEFSVNNTLGSIPVGYMIIWQDKAGSLYQGPSTGTVWTDSLIYLKCNIASVTFKVFLLK